MKNIIFIVLLSACSLFAQEKPKSQELKKKDIKELVEVKDTSGLSEEEVRKGIAKKEKLDAPIFHTPWEKLSPKTNGYDWVQTKEGEWFKGKIEEMYNDMLVFDSEEVGLYTFDFKDISQIKSFHVIEVNIEDIARFSGIVRFSNNEIVIIQGDKKFTFSRGEIISLAPKGTREFNYWSGKISISMDMKTGNTQEYRYTTNLNIKRRTSVSNLFLGYLGNISSNDNKESENNHRISQKYDRYITRRFFWTPVFSEYHKDKFQNIKNKLTAGLGIGYTFVDNDSAEWSVSGGPAYTYTEYFSVLKYEENSARSPALKMGTILKYDITKDIEFNFKYESALSNKKAGKYTHHIKSSLEHELTSWLDLEFTVIWDYLLEPEIMADNIAPEKSDFQFMVGLGVEF